MVKRDELIDFINKAIGKEWLQKAFEKDELANGVQFLGGGDVGKVALGVSLNEDFLKEAVSIGANFCIFHHGFDVRTHKSIFPIYFQKRIKVIVENRITIAGFHYALDAHPTLGNNAVIIKKLGAKIDEPLFEEWGYTGVFNRYYDVEELREKCAKLFKHDVFAQLSGLVKVKKIGVVSGGAKPYAMHLVEMRKKGVELFITGESSESVPHKMKESKINYFVGGHYATEVFGVKELGRKIKEKFGKKVKVEFIDIFNPI